MASAFSADREGYAVFQKVRKMEDRIARFKTRLEGEADEEIYDTIYAQIKESEKRVRELQNDFEGYPAAEIHDIWNEVYLALSGKNLHLRDIYDICDL